MSQPPQAVTPMNKNAAQRPCWLCRRNRHVCRLAACKLLSASLRLKAYNMYAQYNVNATCCLSLCTNLLILQHLTMYTSCTQRISTSNKQRPDQAPRRSPPCNITSALTPCTKGTCQLSCTCTTKPDDTAGRQSVKEHTH